MHNTDQLESKEIIRQSPHSRKKRTHHPEGPAVTLAGERHEPEIKISDEQDEEA